MNKTIVAVLAAASLVVSLAACEKPKRAASSDGPCAGQSLRVSQATDGSMLYIADEIANAKGMYAKQGLTVERIALGGGSEAIQALVGGSADVTLSAHSNVLATRGKGGKVVSFATLMDGLLYGFGAKKGLVPANASEKELAESLRGKRVGITSAGSSTDYIVRYLFLQAGLDPDKDVKITPTGGSSEMVASFARGGIDAYVISPPASLLGVKKGHGSMALDLTSDRATSFHDLLWLSALTSEEALKKKRKALTCYADALNDAMQLIKDNPDDAKQTVRKKYDQLTDAEYDKAFKEVVAATAESVAIDQKQAQATHDFQSRVEGKLKVTSKECVTTDIADRVVDG